VKTLDARYIKTVIIRGQASETVTRPTTSPRVLPSHNLPEFYIDSATILSVAWITVVLVESTAVHGTQCSLGLNVRPRRQLIGIPGLRQGSSAQAVQVAHSTFVVTTDNCLWSCRKRSYSMVGEEDSENALDESSGGGMGLRL
jgi:hypothetical protein